MDGSWAFLNVAESHSTYLMDEIEIIWNANMFLFVFLNILFCIIIASLYAVAADYLWVCKILKKFEPLIACVLLIVDSLDNFT